MVMEYVYKPRLCSPSACICLETDQTLPVAIITWFADIEHEMIDGVTV